MSLRTQPFLARRTGAKGLWRPLCLRGRALALALCLPLGAAQAQGLRSTTASVSLVVIKPAAGSTSPRVRDASVVLPSAWRDADEVMLESDETPDKRGRSPRLFARAANQRLVELHGGTRVPVAEGARLVSLRQLVGADSDTTKTLLVRATARWRADGRIDTRVLQVVFGTT